MKYLRGVDFEQLAAAKERIGQKLLSLESGASTCTVDCIKTPPGEGSPAGLHQHPFDQLFYVLSGTMRVEIDGDEYEAGPGTLIIFPQGVPHRNWNGGSDPTVHLSVCAPVPDPEAPFAIPVEPRPS